MRVALAAGDDEGDDMVDAVGEETADAVGGAVGIDVGVAPPPQATSTPGTRISHKQTKERTERPLSGLFSFDLAGWLVEREPGTPRDTPARRVEDPKLRVMTSSSHATMMSS